MSLGPVLQARLRHSYSLVSSSTVLLLLGDRLFVYLLRSLLDSRSINDLLLLSLLATCPSCPETDHEQPYQEENKKKEAHDDE